MKIPPWLGIPTSFFSAENSSKPVLREDHTATEHVAHTLPSSSQGPDLVWKGAILALHAN